MDDIVNLIFDSLPSPTIWELDSEDDAPSLVRGRRSNKDRMTALPHHLLSNIVARLPFPDAARTTVLSRRWQRVWRRTPLSLDDFHLPHTCTLQRIQIITRILLDHPGPFSTMRLTFTPFALNEKALTLWTRILAKKHVADLILVNIPVPYDFALPAEILCCTALRRLYLGLFRFPCTNGRSDCFPDLRELGLYGTFMWTHDLSYMLKSSPALEKLLMVASYGFPDCISVQSHATLRGLILWVSMASEVCVENSPQMERIVLWQAYSSGSTMTVKISNTPSLRLLGYLEPNAHNLVIDGTLIQSGTRASQHAMVPSLQVLGLRFSLGDKRQSKLAAAYLKCFPNMDTLHVESTHKSGKRGVQFWENHMSGRIECIHAHIKKLYLHQFRGEKCEIAFLKFIFATATLLEQLIVILSPDCLDHQDIQKKLKDLGRSNIVSEHPRILVSIYCRPLTFKMACDLSLRDPFYDMDNLGLPKQASSHADMVPANDEERELLQQASRQMAMVPSNEQSQVLQQATGQAQLEMALNSGYKMPVVGLSMWPMAFWMDIDCLSNLINTALGMGYRHFCSCGPCFTEPKIGHAISQAFNTGVVRREELFISTKVSYLDDTDLRELCSRTLKNLQLEYLDLYLLHLPGDSKHHCFDGGLQLESKWHAMEELVSAGLVRSIGMSNFNLFHAKECLTKNIEPAVLEIKTKRDSHVNFYKEHGICIMTSIPLHGPQRDVWLLCMENPVIKGLAEKYSKTPAQLVFRWCLQRNMVVVVGGLEKNEILEKLKDSLDIFDFDICMEDIKKIESVTGL